MKKWLTLKSKVAALGLVLLCQSGAFAQHLTNCQALPGPVTVKQADGSIITIVGKGNNAVNYTETVDGFTVVLNKKGIYEYAKKQNGDLLASGIPASDPKVRTTKEASFLQKSAAHLRYSEEKVMELNNLASSLNKAGVSGNGDQDDKVNGFPKGGKRKILAILIDYPNMKAQYTAEQFQQLFNEPNYKGTGSFRDFYLANSFGKLDLEVDVVGWYTAENNYETYGRVNGNQATVPLIAKAVDEAEAGGVDFSKYDNDGDGSLDGLIVVHAGPGAEEGSQTKYIWSHRYNLGGSTRIYDGVRISDYMINPETRINGGSRMIGIGVYCHEFGHILGLPDLYDTDDNNGTSAGLGNWCLMAGGNYNGGENTPSCFSAYCKSWLGWVNPITINAEGIYTMLPAASDTMIYRINTPVPKEYFLIENRQLRGFDAKLPGKGLAIFHIDDSVLTRKWGWNSVNADEAKKGIDLEEADGFNHLDKNTNRGDAGDLYPGTRNITSFDDASNPNSKTYNGKTTNVRIYKITQNADSSISFNFGSAPSASFATATTTICQNSSLNITNNSTFASSYNWDFSDGNLDTVNNPTHTFTTPGTYYIKLKVKNSNGQEDIDSVKITVVPNPTADFATETKDLEVTFTNTTINGKTYTWYWGDGKFSINNQLSFKRTYPEEGTYTIKMVAVNENGCKSDTITKTISLQVSSGIAESNEEKFEINAFPNPFSDQINIGFTIQQSQQVEVGVYNLLGQRIALLEKGTKAAGAHKINYDMQPYGLTKGVYLLGISLNGKMHFEKLVKN